jgi:hypothetical protein
LPISLTAQTDLLLKTNSELRNDPVATEMILDMVDVWVSDSVLPRKREHHHVPGGFMWPLVGIKWQRIRETKQKYVGTIQAFDIGRRRILTENDVNFDVASHLPKYQQLALEGYEVQKRIGRAKRRTNYNAAPFDSLPTADNWNRYTLHCEVTPPRDQLGLLDSLFFPTAEGSRLEDHPNFGTVNRQIAVYGAFCSDCNHNCHPEIHPYEWIWWLDLTQPDSIRKWYFALFQEGSNRFPKWSKFASGPIDIPFVIPATADSFALTVHDILADEVSRVSVSVKTLLASNGTLGLQLGDNALFLRTNNEGQSMHLFCHLWMELFKNRFAGSVSFRWW